MVKKIETIKQRIKQGSPPPLMAVWEPFVTFHLFNYHLISSGFHLCLHLSRCFDPLFLRGRMLLHN